MSKRGSKNAINFAGKKWKLSIKNTSIPHPSDDPIIKKINANALKEKEYLHIKWQFEIVCKKFNFKINNSNENLYETYFELFSKISSKKKRIEIIHNISIFKKYCLVNKIDFSIIEYFSNNYYLKISELKNNSKAPNQKSKVNQSINFSKNQISDNLDAETIKKLKTIANKGCKQCGGCDDFESVEPARGRH